MWLTRPRATGQGIIIDSFGELRDQKREIEEDMENTCFICSIDRHTFERQANGFEHHIKKDHCMWHYLYFFIYLSRKPESDYTGQETFVSKMLAEENLDFFPVNRAIVIDGEDDDNDTVAALAAKIDALTKQVMSLQGGGGESTVGEW